MSNSSGSHQSSPSTSPKSPSQTTTSSGAPSTNSSAAPSAASSASSTPSAATAASLTKAQAAIDSLSSLLPSPLPLSASPSPSAAFLLNSPDVSSQISTLLRHPSSGSGDNPLCRWLYDTFHSGDPSLQLVVLRFIPLISGLYLTRIPHQRKSPLAGFEAVLLALYAHETTTRNNQAVSVTLPDLSNPSIYHESSSPQRNNSTDLNIAVVSSSLEPHGTVRSTRRARIVGVAMELFFSKIWVMPVESKVDFCEFLDLWAGQNGEMYRLDGDVEERESKEARVGEGRIPMPWELLQPCLRILGHCLLGDGGKKGELLHEKAYRACRSLYARAMHDVNPKGILAVGGLLRLVKMQRECDDFDHTEIRCTRVISI